MRKIVSVSLKKIATIQMVMFFLTVCLMMPKSAKSDNDIRDAADTTGSQFLIVREMVDINVDKAIQWRNLGVQSLVSNNFHEAIGRFEMSIKLYGDYHDLNELYYLYFQALICRSTEESLRRALWLDQKGSIKTSAGRFVNTFKGHLYSKLGDNEKAKHHFMRATTDNPSVPSVFFDAAVFFYLENNIQMSHKYVLEAIELDPHNTETNALLSRVLYLMSEPELAAAQIRSFQKNMFETTDNACLFMNLKVINEQAPYTLIKTFGGIIRFGGKESEYERIALGNVYYMEKNFKDAMRYYKEAWGKNNESYVTAYNIGNLYFVQGYFNEAVKWYEHALDLNPKSEDARLALAQVYLKQDRYAAASMLTFGMENTLLPKKANYEKFNFIGNIYLENFMYQKAQQCFKLAAGIEKDRADAWAGLALIHFDLRNFDSSMAYVSKALNIEPDNHELLLLESTIIFYRGYYHNIKSDSYYNRAISNLQTVLLKDNTNNTAMNVLMLIYNALNMTEKASAMYSDFTSKSPVNWVLHNTMIMIEIDNGNLLKVKNDTNGAFRHYNFAINHGLNAYDKSENELFILNNIGAAYTYIDSLALAMDNFLQLPQWSVVQNNIAIVYALQGDTEKAIAKFEEIYRNDSTAWFARENIRILTGESPDIVYNPKRGKKNSITYKPCLIRMFYFNFEVNYTFNLKLLPLFQMHDPEFSCPQAEGTNIPNHKYPKPNRYNSTNKIYYN